MCTIGVCGAERLCRQERLALPRWCTSLPAPKTSFHEGCWWKFSGWSILYIIYEAKTSAESVCTIFQNCSIFGLFFWKAYENCTDFVSEKYPTSCAASAIHRTQWPPYTPFLSIEADIVRLSSSFFIPSFLQLVSPAGKSVPTSATPWHSKLNFSAACRNCGRNSVEVS